MRRDAMQRLVANFWGIYEMASGTAWVTRKWTLGKPGGGGPLAMKFEIEPNRYERQRHANVMIQHPPQLRRLCGQDDTGRDVAAVTVRQEIQWSAQRPW